MTAARLPPHGTANLSARLLRCGNQDFRGTTCQAARMQAERIIQIIADWAKAQSTILAVALVGSHARGSAGAGSDIDLVLIVTNPRAFRAETTWLDTIGWNTVGARPQKWQDEDYGELCSRRLWLENNRGEIEFGFASHSWADVNPLDPGTRCVVADGCRILHDPRKILSCLCGAVSGSGRCEACLKT